MSAPLIKSARPCMGTVLEISLVGVDARRSRVVLDAAFAEAVRLEKLLSAFDPESETSRLNREAARGPVAVDPEVFALIREVLRLSAATGGAVDPTVWPLTRFWRSREDGASAPPVDTICALSSVVGLSRVVLDSLAGTVAYTSAGVALEFGAFGKGFAIDRIVDVLRDHGVASALVDFGSTSYALGRPPGKTAWRVGIKHPRDVHRLIDVVELSDTAIATSGDDQQGIVVNGTRYGHVLDPRTGWPASASWSATVVTRTALEADAYATAALIAGPRHGCELLGRLGVEGIITSEADAHGISLVETAGWKRVATGYRMPRLVNRRRVLGGMLAAVAAMLIRPSPSYAVVYLSREEALKLLFPEADGFREETTTLTDAQRERAEALLGSRIRDSEVTFWVGQRGEGVTGYATVLDVIGKEQPITFMVAVAGDGTVRGVHVLTYRESQGSEIRSKRFLKQFTGKTLTAPLKLGRDVHGISGASLSSRSTVYAVKKTLALAAAVYEAGGRSA